MLNESGQASQPPPIDEIKADLAATDRDIERLIAIRHNLSLFIADSHGEDRSKYKVDLHRYEHILRDGFVLRSKIQSALLAARQEGGSDE